MKDASSSFQDAKREHQSWLAASEKRTLLWLAHRMPKWVNSDHLTGLGFISMALAGMSYWYANREPWALLAVNVFLALNWFGDSLDGTLARVRNRLRPRYGFYIDHVLDAVGSLFLLVGLAVSGYMHPFVALGLLIGYLLLMIEVFLTTYTIGTFHLAYFHFGPTELRILLAIGNIALLFKPVVNILGNSHLLFNVGGAIGIVGMGVVFIAAAVRHTSELYDAERLPNS